jgi:hypothetical protein
MFDALKYVTNPLTLIAFLSIVLFYYLRDRNKKQVELLKSGDEGKKKETLEILLDRYQIDSSNLTPQQKYQLIMVQVRNRDSKFKWAIAASIVLGIVGSIIFFMVNATNKLTDLGKNTANIVQPGEVKPGNETKASDEKANPDVTLNEADNTNTQLVSNTTSLLSWHENTSQGLVVQYNKANWNVEDNAAAGYGEPCTGFESKRYPNDIAVTLSVNPWNGGNFDYFTQNVSPMITMMGIKVTEVNRSGQYIAASGFNSNLNKMNVARMYYSPGQTLAVDIIYSKSLEGSSQLKEAVAMMKSAKFQ